MDEIISEKEIDGIVQNVINDYGKGRNIDEINIFNKPDKNEVRAVVQDLFRIVFPGYFRDRTFKIYNPVNRCASRLTSASLGER